MTTTPDHSVREISAGRPQLRQDLRTHFQQHRGEPTYVIEDLANRRYFHIGLPEHHFIQLLDGRTSVAEALSTNAAAHGCDALTQQQATSVLRWCVDHDLLDTSSASQAERRMSQMDDRSTGQGLTGGIHKLLYFKMPMGNPDRFFRGMTRWAGGLFSLPSVILWTLLMLYAGLELAQHADRFARASQNVIAPGNWLWMIVTFGVLKVLHEFGHGIATRRFGGAVPEWGLQILLFITPLTYVDASSSWRFASRWHRISVAAAGMYVELGLAAIAAILWTQTGPGALSTVLHNIIVTASLTTLLFNANPLMRFDGYYILSDLLAIPNLGGKGKAFLQWFGKKHLLAQKQEMRPASTRENPIAVPVYGVLAAIWRVVIMVGIFLSLGFLFQGVGWILVGCLVLGMVLSALGKFVRLFFTAEGGPISMRLRGGFRVALLVAAVIAVFALVPIRPAIEAVAVVEFGERLTLRTKADGFVQSVDVREGTSVSAGDLLLTMTNPQEQLRRDQLAVDVAETEIRAQQYLHAGEQVAYAAEMDTLGGLRERLEEFDTFLAGLAIRAPSDGVIQARHLDSLIGQFLKTGQPILVLTSSEPNELLLSFRQRDLQKLEKRSADDLTVRLVSAPEKLPAKLIRLESRATTQIPHPALSAAAGGPLPVRPPGPGEERETLVNSRFTGRAAITSDIAAGLQEGQWGYAELEWRESEPLGKWLWDSVKSFTRNKVEAVGG